MDFIITLLRKQEFPYLLTVIFALLSWNAVHLANRYIDKPVIEWDLSHSSFENQKLGMYHVKNLSKNIVFKGLIFSLHLEEGNFTSCQVKRLPPADNVSLDYPKEAIFKNNSRMTKIEIKATQFHPSWEFMFFVKTSNDNYPKLNILSKKPVNLVESSWETFIIRNEVTILWISFGFWIALIIIYLIIIKNDDTDPVCQTRLAENDMQPEDTNEK